MRRQLDRIPASSRFTIILIGALITLISTIIVILNPQALSEIENVGYDALLRNLPNTTSPTQVAVVEVDEATLAEMGQWPWPRYRIAALIDDLNEMGVRRIGLDLILAESDRTSLNHLEESYSQDLGIRLEFNPLPKEMMDNDLRLAQAFDQANVILGMWLVFSGTSQEIEYDFPNQPSVMVKAQAQSPEQPPIPEAQSLILPIPVLAGAANNLGFLNALPDRDGKLRRMPLLIHGGDRYLPSLALSTILSLDESNNVIIHTSSAGVEEIQVGNVHVPTDRYGNMLVPFRSAAIERIPTYSAADIVSGRIDSSLLNDKIVFLGATASGLGDIHPTPVSRDTPGVYLHALTADAILREDFVHIPAWERGARVAMVVIAGAIITALFCMAPPLWCALAVSLMTIGLLTGSYTFMETMGIKLSVIDPLLSIFTSFMILSLVRFRLGEKRAFEKAKELSEAQAIALQTLVSVAETRDPETGAHIIRTQQFVHILANQLQTHPQFESVLTTEIIETFTRSAPLHDIGKISIPDKILLKPDKLTEEEFSIMKQHTTTGHHVLRVAEKQSKIDTANSFLSCAAEIALTHHEKWDGSGYPHGLKGEEIPLIGRIMAIADVYDALRSERVYKAGFPHEKVCEIIIESSGTHFDPIVVQGFLEKNETFSTVWQAITDTYTE